MVTECFFNLFLEFFQINYNSNWKTLLGFRNLQEKLENKSLWARLAVHKLASINSEGCTNLSVTMKCNSEKKLTHREVAKFLNTF